jgi:hypothetical protein
MHQLYFRNLSSELAPDCSRHIKRNTIDVFDVNRGEYGCVVVYVYSASRANVILAG